MIDIYGGEFEFGLGIIGEIVEFIIYGVDRLTDISVTEQRTLFERRFSLLILVTQVETVPSATVRDDVIRRVALPHEDTMDA